MDANIYSDVSGEGFRFGIVRARFNDDITGALLASCMQTLLKKGVAEKDVHVVEVPGSMEIPYVLTELAERGPYDALIAIGAIIKGATPHFDYISKSVTDGIREVSIAYRVPVIAGIITTLDRAQAEERAGDGPLNRGVEAAMVALEMASIRHTRGWIAE